MHVFYLHGFASSAQSSKARFFAERLAPFGVTLQCPDFNEPDFETLTTTRMIAQVEAAMHELPPGPVALIGSSLGAFVAWHVAARHQGGAGGSGGEQGAAGDRVVVDRLILLAPALEFGANRVADIGDEALARWRATDRREVFHYAYGELRTVRYALHEDALQYDSLGADVRQPTLVIQGRRDAIVDPVMVERFASTHRNMTLRLVDDEHQLAQSLDIIWMESARFLGLTEA